MRRQVAEIDEDYLEEYAAEVAAVEVVGGRTRASGEQRVDDVIVRACEAKAKGFPPPTDEELGYTMMLIGAVGGERPRYRWPARRRRGGEPEDRRAG